MVAILAPIVTALGYAGAMPDWLKYFIFIGTLGVDSGIEAFTGFGLSRTIIQAGTTIIGVPLVLYSWQVLILACLAPVAFYAIKN